MVKTVKNIFTNLVLYVWLYQTLRTISTGFTATWLRYDKTFLPVADTSFLFASQVLHITKTNYFFFLSGGKYFFNNKARVQPPNIFMCPGKLEIIFFNAIIISHKKKQQTQESHWIKPKVNSLVKYSYYDKKIKKPHTQKL